MEPEDILRDLEAAKALAEQSQADINKLINLLTERALQLITEIYADDLLTMESKGFRDINNVLSQYLTRLAIEVDNIVFNNQV